MRISRKRAAEPLATPAKGRKSSWRVRSLKRLAVWLTPFALDVILRRRKRGPGGRPPKS